MRQGSDRGHVLFLVGVPGAGADPAPGLSRGGRIARAAAAVDRAGAGGRPVAVLAAQVVQPAAVPADSGVPAGGHGLQGSERLGGRRAVRVLRVRAGAAGLRAARQRRGHARAPAGGDGGVRDLRLGAGGARHRAGQHGHRLDGGGTVAGHAHPVRRHLQRSQRPGHAVRDVPADGVLPEQPRWLAGPEAPVLVDGHRAAGVGLLPDQFARHAAGAGGHAGRLCVAHPRRGDGRPDGRGGAGRTDDAALAPAGDGSLRGVGHGARRVLVRGHPDVHRQSGVRHRRRRLFGPARTDRAQLLRPGAGRDRHHRFHDLAGHRGLLLPHDAGHRGARRRHHRRRPPGGARRGGPEGLEDGQGPEPVPAAVADRLLHRGVLPQPQLCGHPVPAGRAGRGPLHADARHVSQPARVLPREGSHPLAFLRRNRRYWAIPDREGALLALA